MDWTVMLIAPAVVAVIFLLQKAGQISAKDAQAHLRSGALVIDVRSPGEFASGHLPEAMNIPLEELGTALPKRVTDRNRVLLLHCLSGARSGIARMKLRGMGYTKVFNLGSLARARKIAGKPSG